MNRIFFLLAVCLGVTQAAFADSDGYFCIGTNYLAYELRGWSVPEGAHVLRVIRVGGVDGISEPSSVALDDFQLHGMKCENEKVILLGWDNKYTVDLKDPEGPKLEAVQPTEVGKIPTDFQAQSFDYIGASIIDIPSTRTPHNYQLHIQSSEERETSPGEGGVIYHKKTATIVEKTLSGRINKKSEIHKVVREETID